MVKNYVNKTTNNSTFKVKELPLLNHLDMQDCANKFTYYTYIHIATSCDFNIGKYSPYTRKPEVEDSSVECIALSHFETRIDSTRVL
jgi:hypothetical protein